jgi:hypothetical protein
LVRELARYREAFFTKCVNRLEASINVPKILKSQLPESDCKVLLKYSQENLKAIRDVAVINAEPNLESHSRRKGGVMVKMAKTFPCRFEYALESIEEPDEDTGERILYDPSKLLMTASDLFTTVVQEHKEEANNYLAKKWLAELAGEDLPEGGEPPELDLLGITAKVERREVVAKIIYDAKITGEYPELEKRLHKAIADQALTKTNYLNQWAQARGRFNKEAERYKNLRQVLMNEMDTSLCKIIQQHCAGLPEAFRKFSVQRQGGESVPKRTHTLMMYLDPNNHEELHQCCFPLLAATPKAKPLLDREYQNGDHLFEDTNLPSVRAKERKAFYTKENGTRTAMLNAAVHYLKTLVELERAERGLYNIGMAMCQPQPSSSTELRKKERMRPPEPSLSPAEAEMWKQKGKEKEESKFVFVRTAVESHVTAAKEKLSDQNPGLFRAFGLLREPEASSSVTVRTDKGGSGETIALTEIKSYIDGLKKVVADCQTTLEEARRHQIPPQPFQPTVESKLEKREKKKKAKKEKKKQTVSTCESHIGHTEMVSVTSMIAVKLNPEKQNHLSPHGVIYSVANKGKVFVKFHRHKAKNNMEPVDLSILGEGPNKNMHRMSVSNGFEAKIALSNPMGEVNNTDVVIYEVEFLCPVGKYCAELGVFGPLKETETEAGEIGYFPHCDSKGKWKVARFEITFMQKRKNGKTTIVCYNGSTLPGHCRGPVYNRLGQVIAYHKYGNIPTPDGDRYSGNRRNAGEMSVAPKTCALKPLLDPDDFFSFGAEIQGCDLKRKAALGRPAGGRSVLKLCKDCVGGHCHTHLPNGLLKDGQQDQRYRRVGSRVAFFPESIWDSGESEGELQSHGDQRTDYDHAFYSDSDEEEGLSDCESAYSCTLPKLERDHDVPDRVPHVGYTSINGQAHTEEKYPAKPTMWRSRKLASEHLVAQKHIFLQPSYKQTVKEANKFAIPLELKNGRNLEDVISREEASVITQIAEDDSYSADIYIPADQDEERDARILQSIGALSTTSTPGRTVFEDINGKLLHGNDFATQKHYIECLGGYDGPPSHDPEREEEREICFKIGTECLAKQFKVYLAEVEAGDRDPAEIFWSVQGKRDKYKATSLLKDKVRSVQAPPMHFKLLWLYACGESDARWNEEPGTPYFTCFNPNKPASADYVEKAESCFTSISTDVTGFDRSMMDVFLDLFFFGYIGVLIKGMPFFLLEFLASATIISSLVLVDGSIWVKLWGNPSGFMNTLRLNCVVNRLVNTICAMRVSKKMKTPLRSLCEVMEHIWSYYCGDDGLNFSLTVLGKAILELLIEEWDQGFPWSVKFEGRYDAPELGFGDTSDRDISQIPPFISRQFVQIRGYWYLELCHPEKILVKILDQPGDANWAESSEFAEVLLGVMAALVHTIHLHVYGKRADQHVAVLAEAPRFEDFLLGVLDCLTV